MNCRYVRAGLRTSEHYPEREKLENGDQEVTFTFDMTSCTFCAMCSDFCAKKAIAERRLYDRWHQGRGFPADQELHHEGAAQAQVHPGAAGGNEEKAEAAKAAKAAQAAKAEKAE